MIKSMLSSEKMASTSEEPQSLSLHEQLIEPSSGGSLLITLVVYALVLSAMIITTGVDYSNPYWDAAYALVLSMIIILISSTYFSSRRDLLKRAMESISKLLASIRHRHEQPAASKTCFSALQYVLAVHAILLVVVFLAFVVVYVGPNFAIEITVLVSIACVTVASVCFFNHGDLQKILMELISGLIAASLANSLVWFVFPPANLKEKLHFISLYIKIVSLFSLKLLATEMFCIAAMQLVRRNKPLVGSAEIMIDMLGCADGNGRLLLPVSVAKIVLLVAFVLSAWMRRMPGLQLFYFSLMSLLFLGLVVVFVLAFLMQISSSLHYRLSSIDAKLMAILLKWNAIPAPSVTRGSNGEGTREMRRRRRQRKYEAGELSVPKKPSEAKRWGKSKWEEGEQYGKSEWKAGKLYDQYVTDDTIQVKEKKLEEKAANYGTDNTTTLEKPWRLRKREWKASDNFESDEITTLVNTFIAKKSGVQGSISGALLIEDSAGHVEAEKNKLGEAFYTDASSSDSDPKETALRETFGGAADPKEQEKISAEADVGKSIDTEQEKDRYMRGCKLYCSLFPADYEFSRDTLIWSWIAADLITPEKSGRTEAVANRCFDELVNSKYLSESGYDHLRDQMMYRIEKDELSILNKQPSEFLYKSTDNDRDMAGVKHLSLIFERIDRSVFESIRKCSQLKTLLLHKCPGSESQNLLHDLFLEMKFLTSLDLSGTNIDELPWSIENLKMLKYLDVSGTPIRHLPESIDSLSCLEMLLLLQCLSLCGLPKRIDKLVNLQHLVLDLSQLSQSMPIGMGKLTNLQTLGAFVVGTRDGNSIRELKNMNKLKGSLCLMNLENIPNANEAREARLCDKWDISKLEFVWSDLQDAKVPQEVEILESLKPYSGLQELKVVSYSGGTLPSWISDPSFTQIANITLYGCRYCETLSSLGDLPSLKSLNIVDMDELVRIDRSFCQKHTTRDRQAFPKLERLSLEGMSNLETWTGVVDGHFPRLERLSIQHCPKLTVLPTLSHFISLQHLEICYCPVLPYLPRGRLPASLQRLMLKDCPKLKERCSKEQGEDWGKVAGVPALYIDNQRIYSSSR
ncbi:uncharacterized protein LOC127265361 [Andrographis paniculata]|uniref:uncharacterized protein LOC127265361 n=1 Tax=Andrographis paniculata TaxID=175694 RepID=UPI0021E7B40F|nr:uncharacterized protein LOC127265361 [Andrographis paniculata]